MNEPMKEKTKEAEIYTYNFSDVVMICHRPHYRDYTVWYVVCQVCGEKRRVKKIGKKQWVAQCSDCRVEYTITPSEFYLCRKIDFSKVIGDI